MYGIDLSVQFENLMPALGLGFILAFFYDMIAFLRKAFFNGRMFLFLSDMIFVVVCTLSSVLLFFAVNSGHIRLYLVLAEILAASVYRLTAGMLVARLADRAALSVNSIIRKVFQPFDRFIRGIRHTTLRINEKVIKFSEKNKNKFKKPLER